MTLTSEEGVNTDVETQQLLTARLHELRGKAIQSYSRLEQSLCAAMAHLAGTTDQIAGVIFFKMVNARSRIAVLERLKRLKYGDEFNLYFNSIMAEAGRLDGVRNNLIHWHTVHSVTGTAGGSNLWDVFLSPPNFWDFDDNSPTLTFNDIQEFDGRCDVFARGLNMLIHHWKFPERFDAWRDRFSQPLRYPLPEGHPLGPSPQEPSSPPEA